MILCQLGVLSAMKMETELSSPVDGTVEKICVSPGVTLKKDQLIIVLKRYIIFEVLGVECFL